MLLIRNWKFCVPFSSGALIQQKGRCTEIKLGALKMARGNVDNLLAHYPNYSTQLEEEINAAPASCFFVYLQTRRL